MKFQMLLIALGAILTGCGEMPLPPQVEMDDLDFKVPMPSVEIPPLPPAPGVEPLIGISPVTSAPTGVNLRFPSPVSVANPNFRESDESEEWNPEFDDFVVEVRASDVPNSAFKVRWLVNDKVVEEEVLKTTGQSWLIGTRWDDAYSGDHILRVIIDADNMINETNENDNTYEVKFSIPD